MPEITVTVRTRVTGQPREVTRRTFPLPENISPENINSFYGAMVRHTATQHAGEVFGVDDELLVQLFRIQVLTGLLEQAMSGPHGRLARRLRAFLELTDTQFLEQYAGVITRGPNAG